MALSMPLNGLKEEDKEPIIELFVKVSARLPSSPAERRALAGPPGVVSLGAERSSAQAPPRGVRHPGLREALLPRPRPIVSGPPAPCRRLGLSREQGWDRDPQKPALAHSGLRSPPPAAQAPEDARPWSRVGLGRAARPRAPEFPRTRAGVVLSPTPPWRPTPDLPRPHPTL